MPTPEEAFSKMIGANVFSKLDASNAYWQVKVDDESAALLTFVTPFGNHQFKRLPFAIKDTGDVLQRQLSLKFWKVSKAPQTFKTISLFGAKTRRSMTQG